MSANTGAFQRCELCRNLDCRSLVVSSRDAEVGLFRELRGRKIIGLQHTAQVEQYAVVLGESSGWQSA